MSSLSRVAPLENGFSALKSMVFKSPMTVWIKENMTLFESRMLMYVAAINWQMHSIIIYNVCIVHSVLFRDSSFMHTNIQNTVHNQPGDY